MVITKTTMMKPHIIIIFLAMLCASCIESGLDKIEDFSNTELVNLRFEHRFVYHQASAVPGAPPIEQLAVVSLPTTVTRENNRIHCRITVPAAGSPGFFTAAEREKVTLSAIVGMANISTAATIKPLGSAPLFGKLGDFSGSSRYVVTAADGVSTSEYEIECTLIK